MLGITRRGLHFNAFGSLLVLLVFTSVFLLTLTPSAFADTARSVMHYEYDGLNRKIEARAYDGQACVGSDVLNWSWESVDTDGSGVEVLSTKSLSEPVCSSAGRLMSFSQTDYDRYNNVTEERSFAVPYDVKDPSGSPYQVTAYDVIVQRYGYEDSAWPNKRTHTYNPRYASAPADEQRLNAAQQWYQGETGVPTLSINAARYCTDIDPSWSAAHKKRSTLGLADQFMVERSGSAPAAVDIMSYVRCAASYVKYDDDIKNRPIRHYTSHAVQYGEHPNATSRDRTYIITELDYYGDSETATAGDGESYNQRGGLKSAAVKGVSTDRVTQFAWDDVGNLSAVTDPRGYVTTAGYDGLRRMVSMSTPEGGESRYAYDQAGRMKAISQQIKPGKWAVTRATYKPDGKLHTLESPDRVITATYSYDDAGRVDTVTDAEGRITKSLYYTNGQAKCVIKALGTPLQQAYAAYDYGPDGQVVSQRPAKGSDPTTCAKLTDDYDTNMTYDGYRRLYETTFPKRSEDTGKAYASGSIMGDSQAGRTFSRSLYDPSGNIVFTRTRAGHLQEQSFDVSGNVISRTTKRWDETAGEHIPENRYVFSAYGGSGTPWYSEIRPYEYNDQNNKYVLGGHRRYIISHADKLGDTLSETLRERYGNGASNLSPYIHTRYYYDIAGNMRRYDYQDGARAEYSYDADGRMASAAFKATPSAPLRSVAAFEYDNLARRTKDWRGYDIGEDNNPAAGTLPGYSLSLYDYDADSELQRVRHFMGRTTGASPFWAMSQSYDYDQSGKMVKNYASVARWRYLPTIDKTVSFASANKLDQYSAMSTSMDGAAATTQTMSYDGSGNLLTDDGERSYQYNAENQLIRITGPSLNMEYWYDAMGRRSHSINHITDTEVMHKHSGQMEVEDLAITRVCAAGQASCVGKPEAPIATITSLSRNIIGAGVDERLGYQIVDGDQLYFPRTNHQGSTVLLTTEDGALHTGEGHNGAFAYDEYGNATGNVPAAGYPYRYTGRRLDAETGLYYYRARYYDPKHGRFLQTDPIGYEDQMNLYAYVHSDPMNMTDPSGEQSIECGGVNPCAGDILRDTFSGMGDLSKELGKAAANQIPKTVNGVFWLFEQNRPMGMPHREVIPRLPMFFDDVHQDAEVAAAILTAPIGTKGAGLISRTDDAVLAGSAVRSVSGSPSVTARWGANSYKHGGLVNALEHIVYRHSYTSGFKQVSRFNQGTSGRDIKRMIDTAVDRGVATSSGGNGYSIVHTFNDYIGYSKDGARTKTLQVYVRDGNIQTGFPK